MWRKRSLGDPERGGEAAPLDRAPVSEPAAIAAPPEPGSQTGTAAPGVYDRHFGLTARPFALAPDPDALFWTPAHRRAYAMLEYGIMTQAPITLITGEVGSGKTTLLHHLLRSMEDGVKVGLVSNPNGSRAELLRWVLLSLGEPAGPDETYVDLFSRFQDFLIAEYAAGRRVVLIFDEAQNLGRKALEELRMFTNINAGKDVLLQLVLVGQPELRDIVNRPDMRQFAQRVSSSFHLGTMDRKTVRAYIDHRLRIVGMKRRIFDDAAVSLIHEVSRGVPRLVNQLCDLAMVYAYSSGRKRVKEAHVRQVLDDGTLFAVGSPGTEGDL
ncbi:MAG: AAA family ATPase [Paracoccaceae bacterium]|nr:AAA family ATPase [Paracoccaceae bacterium]